MASASAVQDELTGYLTTVGPALATAVIGAVIAAISAWAKTWYESRDDRTRASEQLEMATRRTEFARVWLNAYREIEEDSTSPEHLRLQAKSELDAAYRDAQRGFKDGRSAISEATYDQVADQVRGFLLLRPGMSRSSTAIVALFYAAVLTLAGGLGIQKKVPCEVPDSAATIELVEQATEDASMEAQTIDIVRVENGATIMGAVYEPKPSGQDSSTTTTTTTIPGEVPETAVTSTTTTTTTIPGEVPETAVPLSDITVTLTRLMEPKEPLEPNEASGTTPASESDLVPFTDENDVTRTLQTTSDENGKYVFDGLNPQHTYSVSATGDLIQSRTALVTPADMEVESATADLVLQRKPAAPTCSDWWVGSGWVWLFGVIAGVAVLRVLFGIWVKRNEKGRQEITGDPNPETLR